MDFRSRTLICVAILVSVCSAAYLPGKHSAHKTPQDPKSRGEFPSDNKVKCPGKRKWWLHDSITVNISVANTDMSDVQKETETAENHSTAPWNYSLSIDHNRYPTNISEANCDSLSCVDFDGNENPDVIPLPIKMNILVLRRQQKGCSYVFRLDIQQVTTGCSCSRVRTIQY